MHSRVIFIIAASLGLVILSVQANSIQVNASASREITQSIEETSHYWELGDYPNALHKAESLTDIIRKNYSNNSSVLRTPLHNLATIQLSLGLHRKSELNFKRSIRLAESHKGQFTQELQLTLSNLGTLYFDTERYDLALKTFRRAQHIAHRSDGVYSLKQLELVDWFIKISIMTREYKQADTQQRFYYQINEINYGAEDLRIVPALNKLGDWYKAIEQLKNALQSYRKAVGVLEKHNIADHTMLTSLKGISSILYLKGNCCAEVPLMDALEIIAKDPAADRTDEIEALLHLADLNMVEKKGDAAKKIYRRAWSMLTSGDEQNEKADTIFGSPVLLGISRVDDMPNAFYRARRNATPVDRVIYPERDKNSSGFSFSFSARQSQPTHQLIGTPLPLCYPQVLDLARADSSAELASYYMDLDFTVTDKGSVSKVSVVDSNTPPKLMKYVKNMLHKSRYRPRVVAGETVDTEHMLVRQTFQLKNNQDSSYDRSVFNHTIDDTETAASLGCQLLAMQTGI